MVAAIVPSDFLFNDLDEMPSRRMVWTLGKDQLIKNCLGLLMVCIFLTVGGVLALAGWRSALFLLLAVFFGVAITGAVEKGINPQRSLGYQAYYSFIAAPAVWAVTSAGLLLIKTSF